MAPKTMSTTGVPAYEFQVFMRHDASGPDPYALCVAVADSGHRIVIASGTRKQMRNLRDKLLESLRGDNQRLAAIADLLRGLASGLQTELLLVPQNEQPQ